MVELFYAHTRSFFSFSNQHKHGLNLRYMNMRPVCITSCAIKFDGFCGLAFRQILGLIYVCMCIVNLSLRF